MVDYKAWNQTAIHSRLQELVKQPYDLTASDSLGGSRIKDYCCSGAGFDLLYATQRINDEVLDGLQSVADECSLVQQFSAMRRGMVMNRIEGVDCENRQVLHTSCRDLFSDEPAHKESAEQAAQEMVKLEKFLQELDAGSMCNEKGQPFKTMIHVGIGGSDLGPRSLYEALPAYRQSGRKVFFISNVDPDDAAAVLQQVDLETTLVNVVSKSGTTLETLTNETIVRQALQAAGLDPSRHCLAVTGQGSPLDNPNNYLRSFYMYDYIGGRFSSTSMVGMVMLGFAIGYEQAREILAGANEADICAEEENVRNNLPLLLALLGLWNHNYLEYPSLAVLPYSQVLHRFPAHLQQCDMESNGKSTSRNGKPVDGKTGPLIWGEPGTNGQHAFYQLLHQGTEIVPVEFIGFRKNQMGKDLNVQGSSSQQKLNANMLAQSLAMAVGRSNENNNRSFAGNRPSVVLMADQLTPKKMGALLALYEAKIAFQGFLWNINSFDQEGVQLGKQLALRFLELMARKDLDADCAEQQLLRAAAVGVNE